MQKVGEIDFVYLDGLAGFEDPLTWATILLWSTALAITTFLVMRAWLRVRAGHRRLLYGCLIVLCYCLTPLLQDLTWLALYHRFRSPSLIGGVWVSPVPTWSAGLGSGLFVYFLHRHREGRVAQR